VYNIIMGKKTSIKIEDGVINVNEHIFKIPTIKLEKIEESFISENPTEEIIIKCSHCDTMLSIIKNEAILHEPTYMLKIGF